METEFERDFLEICNKFFKSTNGMYQMGPTKLQLCQAKEPVSLQVCRNLVNECEKSKNQKSKKKEKRKNLAFPTGFKRMTNKNLVYYGLALYGRTSKWIERPHGVRELISSKPVRNSDVFFVPRSRHDDYLCFTFI